MHMFLHNAQTGSRQFPVTYYSALYFVPLPVPVTVIYPFCTSLFRIVTAFDLPNPVASTTAELGISLFFTEDMLNSELRAGCASKDVLQFLQLIESGM